MRMRIRFRFVDWSLRAKLAALLGAASLLPVAIWAWADLQQDRSRMLESTARLLEARAEHIGHELDAFHLGYQHVVEGIARFPDSAAYCAGDAAARVERRAALLGALAVYPASDSGIRGVGLIDAAGRVVIATEAPLEGMDLADRPAIRTVLQTGRALISDPFVSSPASGAVPTIVYQRPLAGDDGRVRCIAALWVRAAALWEAVKRSNALDGPASYATVLDREGIRIAHTDSDDFVFRPAGPLDPALRERLVTERRFGDRTRALLDDVRPFPAQFERARAAALDGSVFRGTSTSRGEPAYGVARRFTTVPWTVFYMVPASAVEAPIARATRERLLLAVLVMAAAAIVGIAVAGRILQPVRRLAEAAAAITRGDLAARGGEARGDELGTLGSAFDTMAARIEAQTTELQRAREVLEHRVAERTAALERAQQMTRLGHVVTGPDGVFESWSQTFPALAGLSDAELPRDIRAWMQQLVHPDDRARFRANSLAVASGHERQDSEYRLRHADGSWVHIHQVVEPLPAPAGRAGPTRWFSSLQDVTRQKVAEASLRESEERTRLIVDTALDAVVTMDSGGLITGWNPQAEATFGWTRDEAIGRPLAATIIPVRLRPAHRRGLERYLANGEAAVLNRRVELSALHKSGREFPVDISITPIGGSAGLGFAAFVRDITERKIAEGRVQAQLERLTLLDQITRAIGERQDLQSIYQVTIRSLEERLPADFVGVCRYDAADEVLIVARAGTHASTVLVLTEQERLPIDANGLARCLSGELVYEADVAGVPFAFPQRLARAGLGSMIIAPLQSESRVFGVVVVARRQANAFSSTECEFVRQLSAHVALAARQAELHHALQDAYDELRATQQTVMQQERLRALGQMASGIAHDINNAIGPVALYTESLLEREAGLSDRGRRYLETIARAIDDVAATVARMREFYRQHEPQLALAPVRLNKLVQQVLDLTQARWSDMPQQRGAVVDVQTELAPELPPVAGVESEVREALTNLVLNAVDAMPDGGRLALRTHVAGDRVVVEVADSGVGMDEATRRRCLEPFFTTKGERGSGLGLATVYGVAQRHGAELEIDSAPGRGTTVRLVFPQLAAESAVAAPGEPRRPPRMRVLAVDDDPLMLESLRETLENDGHTVQAVNSGQAGIDALGKASFDVVITDLGMPYVDGRQVAAAAKARAPALPVIMLTGWGQRLQADGEVPAHVDRILSKPPKLRELRAALAQLGQGEERSAANPT